MSINAQSLSENNFILSTEKSQSSISSYLTELGKSLLDAKIPGESSSIKAIIFDCDGTLIDTEEAQYIAWTYAFDKQGYELGRKEYYCLINENSLSGLPSANNIIAQLGAEMIGRSCSVELLNDMNMYCEELRIKGFPAIEPTVNFLHQLAKEKHTLGIKLGLASGAAKHQILINLRHLKIEEYFDVVLSGFDDLSDYVDSEGTNKPKPYIYLYAAKLLGLSPSQCVAIEDSQTGVLSASDAGYITIAVPNAGTLQHDLSRAHLKMESFEGISTADFLQLIDNIKIH